MGETIVLLFNSANFMKIRTECRYFLMAFNGLTFTVYLERYYIPKAERAPVKSRFPPGGAEKILDKPQDTRCQGEEWKQPPKEYGV